MRSGPSNMKIPTLAYFVFQTVTWAQPVFPEPVGSDTSGFISIFDGKSLKQWDADPTYWRVQDGVMVGEVTPSTLLKENSFAIWRGDSPADFELMVEYRVSAAGNSGINYRSVEVPSRAFALKGYQLDIDGAFRWSGQNYEERGRTFLALRGQVTRLTPGAKPAITGSVGDADLLAGYLRSEHWNQVHLIVRGNVLIHLVNGKVMSMVVDEDLLRAELTSYAMAGLISGDFWRMAEL
jgi:hypothetical protein